MCIQEWRNQLRSALHPTIFSALYAALDTTARVFGIAEDGRLYAEILLVGPKVLQALIAATGDYYTWKLAQRICGHHSYVPWTALVVTVISPWQWFCSTRTLSNCLECTLTIIALYNWPWHWSAPTDDKTEKDSGGRRLRDVEEGTRDATDETARLRRALICAAVATILRPTNILIWTTTGLFLVLSMSKEDLLVRKAGSRKSTYFTFQSTSLTPAKRNEIFSIFKYGLVCGVAVLFASLLVDRLYYGFWTFPAYKFLQFNVVQSLAGFYGSNNWHYYLSEGYPLLLTTALPFALFGLYGALRPQRTDAQSNTPKRTLSQLATIATTVPATLSLISHKEVRFIYPLLPILHILAAEPIYTFFAPALGYSPTTRLQPPYRHLKRMLLSLLVITNVTVALYITTVHQSGVINVLSYLRHEAETYTSTPPTAILDPSTSQPIKPSLLTAAFLMPCHSTPWRSHLIHPAIHAWALTCEPPIHLANATSEARAAYLDEADVFYADPLKWLRKNMDGRPPPPTRNKSGGLLTSKNTFPHRRLYAAKPAPNFDAAATVRSGQKAKRPWPEYLIFFEALEPKVQQALGSSGSTAYEECWRGFNSHWHDDSRRRGDVVVYCVHVERAQATREKLLLDSERRSVVHRGTDLIRQLWEGAVQDVKGAIEDIRGVAKKTDELTKVREQGILKSKESSSSDGAALAGGLGPWGIGYEPAVAEAMMFWRPLYPMSPVRERSRWETLADGVYERLPVWARPRRKRWWERSVWS